MWKKENSLNKQFKRAAAAAASGKDYKRLISNHKANSLVNRWEQRK